jgi:hypothetical protein
VIFYSKTFIYVDYFSNNLRPSSSVGGGLQSSNPNSLLANPGGRTTAEETNNLANLVLANRGEFNNNLDNQNLLFGNEPATESGRSGKSSNEHFGTTDRPREVGERECKQCWFKELFLKFVFLNFIYFYNFLIF